MDDSLQDLLHEFRRHKELADRAMVQLDDEDFFQRPASHTNPVALMVKHLAGNLLSRWTDFLTTDAEKPGRNRDAEFQLTGQDTRASLLTRWEQAWKLLFDAVERLTASDLASVVTIRGEQHTARQALLRGLSHAAYHVGQILYVARLLRPESTWLTIPPGQSHGRRDEYLEDPGDGGSERD
jgi:uncharacterized damage-inducible protein DinB